MIFSFFVCDIFKIRAKKFFVKQKKKNFFLVKSKHIYLEKQNKIQLRGKYCFCDK
jgi:hypothetical protein